MEKKIKYDKYDAGACFLAAIIWPSVVGFVYMILATIIAKFCGKNYDDIYANSVFIFFSLFISPIAFSSLFFFYNKKTNVNWVKTLNVKSKLSVFNVILCVIIAIICTFGFTDIVNLFNKLLQTTGFKLNDELPIKIDNFGVFVLMLFTLALLPAMFEELLFRGIIFNGLKDYGKMHAVFGSSILFCLMHLNVEQTIYPFIVGVILGFVMLKTSNIWYPILIHFFNNLIVITSNYISSVNNIDQAAVSLSAKSVIYALIFCVTAAIWIYVIIKLLLKKQKKDSYMQAKSDIIINDEKKVSMVQYKNVNLFLWIGVFVSVFVWLIDLISGFSA